MYACAKCGFETSFVISPCPRCIRRKYSPPAVRSMKFPSIADVADELRLINANVEGECDVRLQVYEDGKWAVRSGLSDYDQDHRGFWGASSVPGVVKGVTKRFNATETAKQLLEQAKEAVFS